MRSVSLLPFCAHTAKKIMAEVKLETSDGQVRSGFVRELEDKGAIIAIDGQVKEFYYKTPWSSGMYIGNLMLCIFTRLNGICSIIHVQLSSSPNR